MYPSASGWRETLKLLGHPKAFDTKLLEKSSDGLPTKQEVKIQRILQWTISSQALSQLIKG
jgi:hypothetical protein